MGVRALAAFPARQTWGGAKRVTEPGGSRRRTMRKTPIKRRSAPKKTNPARRKREFARTLGSKARQKFVQSLPCSACGVVGYSVNAHLLGNGGMSRKGDYTTVGPLCAANAYGVRGGMGCHQVYDEHKTMFRFLYPRFDAEKVARETEELWRASLGSSPGGET